MKRVFVLFGFMVALVGVIWGVQAAAAYATPPPPLPMERDQIQRLPGYTPTAGPDGAGELAVLGSNPADWSKIVYQSYRNGNWDIYMAPGGGSNDQRLTTSGSADIRPRLNRGCTRVAYVSDQDGKLSIFIMNVDGSDRHRLTPTGSTESDPAWSPDGSRIVYVSDYVGQPEIYVMNADGSESTRLTYDAEYDGMPNWSPDGSQIIFVSRRSGGYRIWVMDADGGNQTLLAGKPYSAHPTWSPDGSQIAFDADADGDGWMELWLMNADGSDMRQLYNPGSQKDAWARSWSPNGDYIAFTYISYIYYSGTWYWTEAYTYKITPAGSNVGFLAGGDTDWHPDWQSFDLESPTSEMAPLPAMMSGYMMSLDWWGQDTGPAGLRSFDIQFRDGEVGEWQDLLTDTPDTHTLFTGSGGHSYYFRSRARDHAGNVEPWPEQFDAWTIIEPYPPVVTIEPLPTYSRDKIILRWTTVEPGGSGVANELFQVRDGEDGVWTDLNSIDGGYAEYSGECGHTYYFRARAIDWSGNTTEWTPGDGDAHSTIVHSLLAGDSSDLTGRPLAGVVISSSVPSLAPDTSAADGSYIVAGCGYSATLDLSWSKDNYGSLPRTTVAADGSAPAVYLPTADDVVCDGGFEDGALAPCWQPAGDPVSRAVTETHHTGQYAVALGGLAAGSDSAGGIRQTVTVPAAPAHPVLSFMYHLEVFDELDRTSFFASLKDGSETTTLFTTTVGTGITTTFAGGAWVHEWIDLAPWAGRTVELTFGVQQVVGADGPLALVDEIAVGSAHPDLWLAGQDLEGLPGDTLRWQVSAGNRALIDAPAASLTATLPAGLVYVAASPAPLTSTPTLVWDLGALPAGADPTTVVLTTTIAPDVAPWSTLTNTWTLAAGGPELELDDNNIDLTVTVVQRVWLPLMLHK